MSLQSCENVALDCGILSINGVPTGSGVNLPDTGLHEFTKL